MPRPPGTRALQAFRQTMLGGSVTRAAAALGRTQPAVSRLLKELEEDVGFALFERVRGRLVATPEGRLFFDEVQRSFRGLERLGDVAAEIRQGRRGTLRIAAMPAAAASFLPGVLRHFADATPDVTLDLTVQSSIEVVRLVQLQEVDLGIIEGSVPAPGLAVLRRHALPCALIAPRGHRLPRRAATLGDLDGRDFVALSAGPSSVGAQLSGLLLREGIEPRVKVQTQLAATVSALVLQGLGVGVVDAQTALLHRALGGAVRPLDAPVAMQLRIVGVAGMPPSTALRDLLVLCDDALGTHKLS
ncbi:LysR substrate-binding domain-containing protein [Falsiroseomonas oryziterrae]|uniref:LysR substrate-binding domain-containing protein n=1 Tax=Falsiroseomonas oryziterrae TaxID=2911368 RepID=UPI001F2066A8|nr:LysR substrate-binding domain-containing protein [Roseomonas sp. NPKOSM-4]